jgi:ribosomal protein L40E
MDPLMFIFIVVGLLGFGLVAGAGRPRDEMRNHRRWESAFYAEAHKEVQTDATGVLMCRQCGASASERAGRCPSCGASL